MALTLASKLLLTILEESSTTMGVQKKARKVKRIISQRDARLKKNQDKGETEAKKKARGDEIVREMSEALSPLLVTFIDRDQPSGIFSAVLPV